MEFKINNSSIVLDDDVINCLTDVGYEYNLDLSFDDVVALLKTDENVIMLAFQWGHDSEVSESFLSTISKFLIGKNFKGYPESNESQEKFRKEVEIAGILKGYKKANFN